MNKFIFRFVKTALTATALMAATVTSSMAADALRVCSDPDNLPFSKSEGADKGLYIELADMVGQRMGAKVEYVWWLSFNQRKALRNTMEGCDAYFALPADAEYKVKGLTKSNAFLNVSYAIVAPQGLTVTTLSDLKPKKIGVLHASPPQILLASKGGYTASTFRSQEEVFEALNKKEIDAALLWGPSAGFDNKKLFDNRWQVIPINGEGLGGQVAVAVSKDNPELKERINKALEELKPEIQQLTVKYGFPLQVPLIVNVRKTDTHYAQSTVTPAKTGFMKVSDKPKQREWLVAESGDTIAEAKSNFNNKCSHCHGSNGASPISERDLRKLSMRYKEEWKDVAYNTITKGRPDLGMPTWGGILPEEEIKAIIEFLATTQKK
ncbi:MAG: transporter substrate-binding domain-containing protein [Betaproteobacteria bacterium]|jgi:ABC-type amino acid transport substrate-binding protein/cytochrome c5